MTPIAMLLWAELMYPGADSAPSRSARSSASSSTIRALDQSLGEWRWFDRRAIAASCSSTACSGKSSTSRSRCSGRVCRWPQTPMLARFYEEFPARPTCEALLADQPCPITARPEEAAAIAKIQQLLG